jgi:rhodanese-related sulfurtransferase
MPTSIDRAELQRLVRDEQAQVVEVLPAEEFEEEHIPGAVSLPLKQLDAASARALDPSRPVVVYCWDSI